MHYLSIGIKIECTRKVELALLDESLFSLRADIEFKYKSTLSIRDYRYEFAYAKQFLLEHSLEDDNEFFRVFDIDPFAIMVEVTEMDVSNPDLKAAVFDLSRQLSGLLETDTIYMKDNLSNPVALFSNGNLIRTW